MNMNSAITITDGAGEIIPPSLAVKAMRDSGYKNTAFALAELIDNSAQASADMIEVFCIERRDLVNQRERRRLAQIGVLDNGSGMDASTLRLALQFGNGTHLQDRHGIGRFGMGLPNASISQCRRVDIWSWQAGPDNAMHTYLDIDEIESGKTRVVPEPQAKPLPPEWRDQSRAIGTTGTLVVWSNFEDHRLTWKTAKVTLEHTENLVGRIYRKFIHNGKVTIRLVAVEDDAITFDEEARVNDPLYLMAPSSTPAPFHNQPMFQPWGDGSDMKFEIELGGKTHTVIVRMSWARPETIPEDGTDRGSKPYGKHAAKNVGVSIIRADRELDLDDSWANGYDPRERWWGIEVDFPPALDEVFGVTNNKQAATVFSYMAHFDWEAEKEAGESYMDFKRRLQEEGDTRYFLMDIVNYIHEQLRRIREALQDQSKGRRSNGRRHEDVSPEDTATTIWKKRAKDGYKIKSDDEQYDELAQKQLIEDLIKNKHYKEREAREIANAVLHRQRKVIFVAAHMDSQAFFSVEIKPGGITEVVFNMQHPVYEKLIKVLDDDLAEDSPKELIGRVQNAADVLKLLFAAWARYEEEDVPNQESIRDVRHEWGKMAKNFLKDVN